MLGKTAANKQIQWLNDTVHRRTNDKVSDAKEQSTQCVHYISVSPILPEDTVDITSLCSRWILQAILGISVQ